MKPRQVLIAVFITMAMVMTGAHAFASLTTTTVMFGNSTAMGCGGKGICSAGITGINVTFRMIDQNTLEMSFVLNDLMNSQPDKVKDFQGQSYAFDANYYLGSQIFYNLGLAPNAMISTSSQTNVYIKNGVVYDDIAIAYGK